MSEEHEAIGEVIAELPDAEKPYATLALYEELEDVAIGEVLQLSAGDVEVLRVTTQVMITHGLRKRLNAERRMTGWDGPAPARN